MSNETKVWVVMFSNSTRLVSAHAAANAATVDKIQRQIMRDHCLRHAGTNTAYAAVVRSCDGGESTTTVMDKFFEATFEEYSFDVWPLTVIDLVTPVDELSLSAETTT